jgi:hypothetical protein
MLRYAYGHTLSLWLFDLFSSFKSLYFSLFFSLFSLFFSLSSLPLLIFVVALTARTLVHQ